jgi:hypothetical protein
MPRVPDSSVRTAQVAATAFTRVKVGLNQNGVKPNSIAAALEARGYKIKGIAGLRGGR